MKLNRLWRSLPSIFFHTPILPTHLLLTIILQSIPLFQFLQFVLMRLRNGLFGHRRFHRCHLIHHRFGYLQKTRFAVTARCMAIMNMAQQFRSINLQNRAMDQCHCVALLLRTRHPLSIQDRSVAWAQVNACVRRCVLVVREFQMIFRAVYIRNDDVMLSLTAQGASCKKV